MARETAAQRKERAAAEAAAEATQPNESSTQAEVAAPAYSGVFVLREISEDGSVETKVIPQGDVRVSEVETILGLGLKGWRQQIGV